MNHSQPINLTAVFDPLNFETSSQQTFSKANIFGIFLTLQLCQLTQPYGSLLFRGTGGWLWRCNPIASFAEAGLIIWILLKEILSIYFERRRKHKSGQELLPWKEELCALAAAILLLRGAIGDDSDGGLMEKLLTGTFIELQPAARGNQQNPTSIATTSRNQMLSTVVEGESSASNGGVESGPALASEVADGTAIVTSTAPRATETNLPQPGIKKRRTAEVEAGIPQTPSVPSSAPRSAVVDPLEAEKKMLRETFGSNALAHREIRIDALTFVSEILILIKLLAILEAPWFTTGALFMIVSWFVVQVLLIFLHACEMDDVDMSVSRRLARTIDAELKESHAFWSFAYVILHEPLIGYLSYLFAFRISAPDGFGWLATALQFILATVANVAMLTAASAFLASAGYGACLLLVSLAKVFFALLCMLVDTANQTYRDLFDELITILKSLAFLALALVMWWAFFGLVTWLYYNSPTYGVPLNETVSWYLTSNSTDNSTLITAYPTNIWYDIFMDGKGFPEAITWLWFVLIVAFLSSVFYEIIFWNISKPTKISKAAHRQRVSIANAVISALTFGWFLLTYNAQGTTKPDWIEWLG